MHDLVIRGATIVDGTGAPGRLADLAVTGGRIAEIGSNLGAATETIEADGLVLAPGIIDTHTHFDAQITWDPGVTPSPELGVTTTVIGNCGKVSKSQRMPLRKTSSDMPSTWVRLRSVRSRCSGLQGAMVKPQLPMATVVTPSRFDGVA